MKVKENKFAFNGTTVLWLLPSLTIAGCKYSEDVQFDYKRWIQFEFIWIFWSWTLWIEFDKIRP